MASRNSDVVQKFTKAFTVEFDNKLTDTISLNFLVSKSVVSMWRKVSDTIRICDSAGQEVHQGQRQQDLVGGSTAKRLVQVVNSEQEPVAQNCGEARDCEGDSDSQRGKADVRP